MTEECVCGCPLVFADDPCHVKLAVPGQCNEEGTIVGLSNTIVYDPQNPNAYKGAKKQRDESTMLGNIIKTVCGDGWVKTSNYQGELRPGDLLYPAIKTLSKEQTGEDLPVAQVETEGNNGDIPVRIRLLLGRVKPWIRKDG